MEVMNRGAIGGIDRPDLVSNRDNLERAHPLRNMSDELGTLNQKITDYQETIFPVIVCGAMLVFDLTLVGCALFSLVAITSPWAIVACVVVAVAAILGIAFHVKEMHEINEEIKRLIQVPMGNELIVAERELIKDEIDDRQFEQIQRYLPEQVQSAGCFFDELPVTVVYHITQISPVGFFSASQIEFESRRLPGSITVEPAVQRCRNWRRLLLDQTAHLNPADPLDIIRLAIGRMTSHHHDEPEAELSDHYARYHVERGEDGLPLSLVVTALSDGSSQRYPRAQDFMS